MTLPSDEKQLEPKEAYLAAMAAYAIIRTTNLAQVRRAEMRQGEVKAEPIDFVCDVETRAKLTLTDHNELLLWWDVLEEPDRYPGLPEYMQEELGLAFTLFDLGISGPYRQLYFRLKNQSDRRRLNATQGTSDTDYTGGDATGEAETADA